jgi:hypothetical protein
MRCVAIIEASRPGLDSVIIWDQDGQLVAFAYEDGRVKMTRPLAAANLDQGIGEVRDNFQITATQVTRLEQWVDTRPPEQQTTVIPARWELST